jgi:hypothetical protein
LIKWGVIKGPIVKRYYRATIVDGGNLPLYAYISNNGAGWYNWCISPSDDDEMMEHPHRITGGARTLTEAKTGVYLALRAHIEKLAAVLDLKLRR